MKKWILLSGAILVLLLVVVFVVLTQGVLVKTKEPVITEVVSTVDTLSSRLPADPKAARKELEKARKALAKLKPAGQYIVIDTHSNRVYLRTDSTIILDAVCSAGSGGELVDSATGRHWKFSTPRGVFKINSKQKDPWWRKPDWAYIEENEKIPKNDQERLDSEMLGEYAMGFGDGYFIHGTIYERLLGVSVTHGCVRLGSADITKLYEKAAIGTPVYVY